MLALFAVSGRALDPNSSASAFLRDDFTVENGLPSNVVNAIVQTRNGFLWIGTDAGLVRFNGRQFVPIYFRAPTPVPQGIVRALAEGPDGALWVGTGAGLARIARSALDFFDLSQSVFYHPGEGASDEITCLHFTRDGSLWVGTDGGLYRFTNGRFAAVLSGAVISRIEDGLDDRVLVVMSQGYIELDGKRFIEHRALAAKLGIHSDQFFHVFEDRQGTTWFCTLAGLARGKGDRIERFSGYGTPGKSALRIYQDRQGTIWVAFERGLYRISSGVPEPLLLTQVREIYSDRDGDLWIGTNGEGLLRFKDRSVRMFTKRDGLPSNIQMTALARQDGSLWVGSNCGGLSVFEHGRFRTYAERDGLTNSCVWALAEDKNGVLWVGTWGGGLFRFANGHFSQLSLRQGLAGDVVRGIQVARDGSLWIAIDGGVSHILNGLIRNYTLADGLSSNRVLAVYQDRYGGIWAGTNRGIDRMTGGRFVPVSPGGRVFDPRCINFGEDSSGNLYVLDAPKGLDRIEGNHLVNINRDLDLFSMVAVNQDLWFSGGSGIFRFASADLKPSDQGRDLPASYTSFGSADGMKSTECSIGAPNMTLTPDGELWVATVNGLAELEPRRLPNTRDKPVIFVSEVTIGRRRQIAGRELVLPPGTHHTELHFDSISLKSPEKVQFQYRLEGIDPVWLDADKLLTAVYTNIPVGAHPFHVRASNSDGVWDPNGIVYLVTQQPYFYETAWFRPLVVVAIAFLLGAAYWLRLRQIAHVYNLRLDERVRERTRIARELHDTLLQSLAGVSLQLNGISKQAATSPEKTPSLIAGVREQIDCAFREARHKVWDLRSPALEGRGLVAALREFVERIGPTTSARCSVTVFGRGRPCPPEVEEELFRIAQEAASNAIRHAHANEIDVSVEYAVDRLTLSISDDGRGFNFEEGYQKFGHWGLKNMQQRAAQLRGTWQITTAVGQGTQVAVRVPLPSRSLRNTLARLARSSSGIR